MKLFQKKLAASILCLCGTVALSGAANAFWPFSCDDSQKCKEKFDKSCEAVEISEEKCHQQFADLYSVIEKLTSDMRILKESQISSENILVQLTQAYQEWSQENFRIDTEQHTNYILLRKKFADQNRVVEQNEQMVKSDMKIISGFLNTKTVKDGYVGSLKDSINAYYKYSMAVAKEDIDNNSGE